MKEQSTRQLKVGQEIKEILSKEFLRGDIYDLETRQSINITISEVKVSPDLRNATVYYIPFGVQKTHKSVQKSLEGVAGRLKGLVGKQMHIRNIPSFIFRLDNSFDEAKKMNDLINGIDKKD
jgi:ribosome-binding factor A